MTHDITPILRDWLDETISSVPDPVHLYPAVAADAHTAPQQRSWWPPFPTWRFQSMLSTTAFVVAGVIVATVGVGLYTTVERQPGDGDPVVGAVASSPSPVAAATSSPIQGSDDSTAPPSELADAAIDADSGVLDTPAGRFEWTRIPGEDLPDVSGRGLARDLMEWHDGGLAFGPSYGEAGPLVWASDDGAGWQAHGLPGGFGAEPFHVDGVSWVASAPDCCSYGLSGGGTFYDPPRPAAVFRSVDGEAWKDMTLGASGLPGPIGFDWEVHTDSTATRDKMVLIESARARLPLPKSIARQCRGDRVELRKHGRGRYSVRRVSHAMDCKSDWMAFRVTQLQRGLRMVDAKTGKRIRDIKGATLADLERFIGSHRGVEYGPRVIAVSDTGVEISEAPWAGRNLELLDMAVLDGDIYVYLWNQAADVGPVVYRTTDGTEWTELGSEALPGGVPADASIDIVTWPGRVFATSHEKDARQDWVSADGVIWEPGPAEPPEGASLVALPSGWFAAEVLPGYRGDLGDTAWMYAGGEWVSLDPLGFDCADVDGGTRTSWGAARDTTFIRAHRDCGPLGRAAVPDLWILTPGA